MTPVEISGTPEQQAKAKQMIEDLTIPAGDLRQWAEKENREFEEKENAGGFKPVSYGPYMVPTLLKS